MLPAVLWPGGRRNAGWLAVQAVRGKEEVPAVGREAQAAQLRPADLQGGQTAPGTAAWRECVDHALAPLVANEKVLSSGGREKRPARETSGPVPRFQSVLVTRASEGRLTSRSTIESGSLSPPTQATSVCGPAHLGQEKIVRPGTLIRMVCFVAKL